MRSELIKTEVQIKVIKDFFEKKLSEKLNLTRVSAPLFVEPETGLNDNLNGIERPVSFDIAATGNVVEVVHSLAKWKRMSLQRYGFEMYSGLYTDMNAIRRDEVLDELHSIYVDQWDWEKIISKADRNKEFLMDLVKDIYDVFKETEVYVNKYLKAMTFNLPQEIYFITTTELEAKYPTLTPKEREDEICKEKGAVFLMEIGDRHDGRSPDYDDWKLNGDIIVWYPILNRAFELSSMGIRVDKDTLITQLQKAGCEQRAGMPFHKAIINEELPYTVGGGIGQSRICMLFLGKTHIGEVQASVWDEKTLKLCKEKNIELL